MELRGSPRRAEQRLFGGGGGGPGPAFWDASTCQALSLEGAESLPGWQPSSPDPCTRHIPFRGGGGSSGRLTQDFEQVLEVFRADDLPVAGEVGHGWQGGGHVPHLGCTGPGVPLSEEEEEEEIASLQTREPSHDPARDTPKSQSRPGSPRHRLYSRLGPAHPCPRRRPPRPAPPSLQRVPGGPWGTRPSAPPPRHPAGGPRSLDPSLGASRAVGR